MHIWIIKEKWKIKKKKKKQRWELWECKFSGFSEVANRLNEYDGKDPWDGVSQVVMVGDR
jgi:hypothetical protein